MEHKLLKISLDTKENFDLVNQYITLKDYSREFSIVFGFVKDYYERDSKANHVDVDLLKELISSEVQNEKHADRFKEFLDETTN